MKATRRREGRKTGPAPNPVGETSLPEPLVKVLRCGPSLRDSHAPQDGCRKKVAQASRLCLPIARGDSYLSWGRMMPRRMIFWQSRKTARTGMELTMKAAITVKGWPVWVW